jgi:hypothetical protein
MNCNDARKIFSEHAFDIASPEQRGAVERHLTMCAACARAFEETRAAAATLTAALVDDSITPVPRADAATILETARRERRARPAPLASEPFKARALRWFPLAAGILFAAAGAAGAAVATAQTRRLEAQMERYSGVLLEEARSEARKTLFPLLEHLNTELDMRDEAQRDQLQRLCEWIDRARVADREGVASALTDTREDIARTQFALRNVAERVPLVR